MNNIVKAWKKEEIKIDRLHRALLAQATALQIMSERLQRVDDTARYLMEVHYYQQSLGKDQSEETTED